MSHSALFKSAICALMVVTLGTSAPATAQGEGLSALFGQKSQRFLPVHEAFKVKVHTEGTEIVAVFRVTPEHYLYRDKLSLRLPNGVQASKWQFDKTATMMDDPTFGRVAVFEEDVVARAMLTGASSETTASLRWQGCAKAGLCYPPELSKFELNLPQGSSDSLADGSTKSASTQKQAQAISQASSSQPSKKELASTTEQAKKPTDIDNTKTTTKQSADTALPNIVQPALSSQMDKVSDESEVNVSDGQLVDEMTPVAKTAQRYQLNHDLEQVYDPFGIHDNPVLAIGLLFLAGLLLSLTPCVYPMIPIVANIVARQNTLNTKKGLLLSSAYGLGVATSYGILGAIIAWFGRAINVMGYLQNPAVLIGFALLFVILALYMFDAISVGLPTAIREKLQGISQMADDRLGRVGGSFLSGMLSALVVSPCVSAPMAGVLAAVSVSGSVLFGFLALFALGVGLSVPLALIGMAQGRLMPKAGGWMIRVKELCGLLLLAVAVSMVERVFISVWVLPLWAVWFAMVGVWLWRLTAWVGHALALLAMLWAGCLMVGAGMGSVDAWRPLAKLSMESSVQENYSDAHITTLDELDGILSTRDKVVVDVTADWCIECRIMDRELFMNRPDGMAQVQLVKFDITEVSDDSRALLSRYQLMGPPALLIYQEGKLTNVMLGQTSRQDFESALRQFD
ncbi:sulfite exporter TauE/SafE family protein [Moraxella haemolytica]|uniref:cytochrome c biogenesis protein CcdA n=1 Tax=Moraxella haemolytica TaxID=2904119 RepID=UPI002543B0F3|nr:protein-disulfide reductase DsbD domain-containing protein [Moraxella sp. ZY171148]WII94627.1 sulfite exporter TauE/SafE family protein [Moraxella sp. ZY171148]